MVVGVVLKDGVRNSARIFHRILHSQSEAHKMLFKLLIGIGVFLNLGMDRRARERVIHFTNGGTV